MARARPGADGGRRRRRSWRSARDRALLHLAAPLLLPRDREDRLHGRDARSGRIPTASASSTRCSPSNSLWYPLRYPAEYQASGKRRSTRLSTITTRRPRTWTQILSLHTFRDFGGGSLYNDSFGFLDQNPHNTMHIWTGGMNPDQQPKYAARRRGRERAAAGACRPRQAAQRRRAGRRAPLPYPRRPVYPAAPSATCSAT